MNVIDLFAGAGGFSLGAHSAGFAVPLAIDLDENLTASRHANFPDSQVLHVDLARIAPADVLRMAKVQKKEICGIVGGPPCQGFSFIGARDPKDARNNLILDYCRFVRLVAPSFFVLENVPGILAEPFRAILQGGLDSLGQRYTIVGPLYVDAADFGAATRRRRVLVIGYDHKRVNPLREQDIRAAQHGDAPTVYEAIHDLAGPEKAVVHDDGYYYHRYRRQPATGATGAYARRARKEPASGLATEKVRRAFAAGMISGFNPTQHTPVVRDRLSRLQQGVRDSVSKCPRLSWKEPCPTLRAGTGADRGSYQSIRPIHPQEHRVITVREAARLQGFPDWFQFHPTIWHSFRMIGNSVSPMVATAVLKLLKDRVRP